MLLGSTLYSFHLPQDTFILVNHSCLQAQYAPFLMALYDRYEEMASNPNVEYIAGGNA